MGRRGPPKKPTALRLLEGNAGKRPINPREPKPPRLAPRCPEWLSDAAKREWRRLAPQLERLGVLTQVDGDALAAYCQTFVRWRAAEAFLDKHGDVYPLRDEAGQLRCMQQFPQVSIARNLLQLLKSYQQEFGLTPASRPGIRSSAPESETFEDFLRERRDPAGA